MNIFKKIGAMWKVREIAKEATEEVKTVDGIKPGWRTTEFWGKNIVQLVVLYNAFAAKDINPELALQMVAAIEGLYHALRAAIKVGKEIAETFKKKQAVPVAGVQ